MSQIRYVRPSPTQKYPANAPGGARSSLARTPTSATARFWCTPRHYGCRLMSKAFTLSRRMVSRLRSTLAATKTLGSWPMTSYNSPPHRYCTCSHGGHTEFRVSRQSYVQVCIATCSRYCIYVTCAEDYKCQDIRTSGMEDENSHICWCIFSDNRPPTSARLMDGAPRC
jgi:hypothetical protein